MPKNTNASENQSKDSPLPVIFLVVSGILTVQFVYQICWIAQQYAWYAQENSPKTYNVIVAALLAAYVWTKANRPYQKYVVVGLLTTLVISTVIWFLGDTGAGQYLRNASGFWV